jgi:hypothetical protein
MSTSFNSRLLMRFALTVSGDITVEYSFWRMTTVLSMCDGIGEYTARYLKKHSWYDEFRLIVERQNNVTFASGFRGENIAFALPNHRFPDDGSRFSECRSGMLQASMQNPSNICLYLCAFSDKDKLICSVSHFWDSFIRAAVDRPKSLLLFSYLENGAVQVKKRRNFGRHGINLQKHILYV